MQHARCCDNLQLRAITHTCQQHLPCCILNAAQIIITPPHTSQGPASRRPPHLSAIAASAAVAPDASRLPVLLRLFNDSGSV